MRADDIQLLWSVSSPSVSPDGATIVFAASHPDLRADATVGQLFAVAADGSAPATRMTRGFRDSAPAFSPDGSLIAFVRSGPKDAPQLYLIPAAGGEPVQVTDRKLGVGAFEWAPDGASIAFSSREPEHGRYGTVEGLEAPAEAPRHFTDVRYKSNGTGYVRDRRTQLFVVEVPPVDGEPTYPDAPAVDDRWDESDPTVAEPRQLTVGDAEVGSFAWMPDSTGLYFAAGLHESRETDLRSHLYSLYLAGLGTPTRLTAEDSTLSVDDVVVTPAGSVFFTAQDMGESHSDFVGKSTGVFVLDDGATRLTSTDRDFGEAGSYLSTHGADAVLAVERYRGVSRLFSISRDAQTELFPGPQLIEGHASAGSTIAVAFSGRTTTGEIAVVDSSGLEQLTDFHTLPAFEMRALEITARDGYPIAGWITVPEGDGPHPALLMIHGGPFASYSQHFFDEAEVLAGAGYAVVYCNPRGSAGYGEEHGRAIIERMGTLDHFDVLDFLDGAIATDSRLDATRLGILGGSYGGYLTAWTIAHDKRFTAAIVERGFLDPEVFPGTSDIGDFFGREYMGTDLEGMRAQSPQAVVGSVTTPTFVIHSENDLRCPLGQAERYFASLRANGVEAELLIFPGENHELSRSGRPRHRVQRFEAILDWWDRYLPVMHP
jgi:dipeptidyl aminopeptidase/acylaminoacyl peptidase